ncbi:gamma carbonic anhydrase family protein [Methanolobus halotolerans]|uniref:Gamma carbonic anhydrase family protein n=2 Tax=Methanolobus halotolerans TaxID=2052935 RepID=A0A4E0R1U3_9EURY|nr:gamma carbonic anhydrase family protein [Methanolobus halotolerans]
MIIDFKDKSPSIAEETFIADSAEIIGDVKVGKLSSIWFNAIVRGDMGSICIGSRTSIQDNVVIHTDTSMKTDVGDDVTVGHGAVIHGCRIGSNVIIGMNSTILNGAVIGNNSIIGANALVPEGKQFPDNSIVVGIPAKVIREVTNRDIRNISQNAAEYVELAKEYKHLNK